jgi:hypothetical protein
VDQFGKIWKFQEEIGGEDFNEKDILKEIFTKYNLSRRNLYQRKWDLRCQKNKSKGGCKYAGIYLKENECLYTRGEHEHQ